MSKHSPRQPQGCLAAIFGLLDLNGGDSTVSNDLPYHLRDDFLSQAELSFFKTLKQAIGDRATILAKVNLADLFFVSRPNENLAYRNKINRKHVDFLVCESTTMRPMAGVELDDASHSRQSRIERDQFVDQVFDVAGLPLIRVKAARTYDLQELRQQIDSCLKPVPQTAPVTHGAVDEAPLCPKCGQTMIKRVAQKGSNAGRTFWGCSQYPHCRGVLEIS